MTSRVQRPFNQARNSRVFMRAPPSPAAIASAACNNLERLSNCFRLSYPAALSAAACLLITLTLIINRRQPALLSPLPGQQHSQHPPVPSNNTTDTNRSVPDTTADMNQFSLWAMPPEGSPFGARAAAAIRNVSERKKCTPFEPHVTVIGAFGAGQGLDEVAVVARTRELCRSLKPYTVRVLELSSGDLFFQCVYLKMLATEEVMEANRRARSKMAMDLTKEYMPHLSLIYGDLSQVDKEEVKDVIKSEFSDLIGGDASFRVDSLVLYRTDPKDRSMESWERLGTFPLEGQD